MPEGRLLPPGHLLPRRHAATRTLSLAATPQVYDARSVTMDVRVKGEKGPANFALPTAGFQTVTPKTGGDSTVLTVTIDLQAPVAATAEELADKEYRLPSAMVDNSDEVIIDLAHRVDPQLAKLGIKPPPRVKAGAKPPRITPKAQVELAYQLRDLVQVQPRLHLRLEPMPPCLAPCSRLPRAFLAPSSHLPRAFLAPSSRLPPAFRPPPAVRTSREPQRNWPRTQGLFS